MIRASAGVMLAAVGLLLVACGSAQAPEPQPEPQKLTIAADMSAPRDLTMSSIAVPACRSCSQSDPGACGGVPSVCGCYPGPACCCR